LDDLAAKAVNLVASHVAEFVIERVAGFKLRAVNQQCARSAELVAVLVEVSEKFEAAILQRSRAVIVFAMKARDVIVDQLGGGRVVADYNEARRNANPFFLPQLVCLVVVTVEQLATQFGVQRAA
jgi:hypothetical protein